MFSLKRWLRGRSRTSTPIRTRARLGLTTLEGRETPASMYDVAWLGMLNPGDNFSEAVGINDKGQVVGNSWVQDANGIPGVSVPFTWTAGGGLTSLGTAGGNAAFAWAINNNGLVSGKLLSGGTLATGGYYEWAALWNGGTGSGLPGLANRYWMSVAYGSNDSNVVVGNADLSTSPGDSGAFVYDGTTTRYLNGLGGKWDYGMDINNAGYVAGFADTGANPSGQPGVYQSLYHAVIWAPDGTVKDLGTFGTDSYAYKINESGQAVGSSLGTDGFYHAFLYDGTRMLDVGLPGNNYEAMSINNAGQVVGDTVNWQNSTAFLYEGGANYDLNTLVSNLGGDSIMSAHDINNLGQIVGYGLHNGQYQAFVLSPNGLTGGGGTGTGGTGSTGGGGGGTGGGGGGGGTTSGGPVASVTGPSDGFDGVTAQDRTITLDATDPNQTGNFEFTVDWGDGTIDTVNGNPGDTATHAYDAAGTYTVSVTVTNADDVTSDPATVDLTIHGAELQGSVLAVGGTSGDDTVTLAPGAAYGTVVAAGQTYTTSQVMVYGGGGNDRVAVKGTAGNDTFGINPDAVALNGVAFQGTAVEGFTADALAGTDTFYINGPGLPVDLKGGDGNDTFKVTAIGAVNGTVDGGAGSDILDYSQYHSPATVNLQTQAASATGGIANVEGFVGSNTLLDTIVGKDTANAWQVYGNNNAGKINGTVQFSQFENWVGGAGDDSFKMASARYVSGVIDGGAGSNTLDYSLYTSAVAVDLGAGTATNARGGIANIANVSGGSGGDTITGNAGDNLILGNGGNDVLRGGTGGNDVLAGGAGNDTLTGGGGRNLLAGGAGADTLTGGAGEDILIGGTTSYDANAGSLKSLMAEWGRTDLAYQQRIDYLTGTAAGGLNGSSYLKSTTVKDDATTDRLTGAGGLDWFWGLTPELADRQTGERLN